jgi:hypothetical protein
MEMHEGGCACGAVRYRVEGRPQLTSACHCTFCQRRTGSAFGLAAYFEEAQVRMLCGELRLYEHRSDESGRTLYFEFCPRCGTQLTWTVEASPGLRGVAVGTFDDPKWLSVQRFGWFRSAQPWIVPPKGVEVFEKSALRPAKR